MIERYQRRLRHAAAVAPALLLACPSGRGPGPHVGPAPEVRAEPSRAARQPTPQAPPRPLDPPRVLTDAGSGIVVIWAGAAESATVAGSELVVLEPDGRHLGAIDWDDGEARWRIELPASQGARLHGLGDRVLLHDDDHATMVEAARGRVLGRHPAPIDARWPYSHAVVQRRDACAWEGPCGIQAFDCREGAPLGSYYRSEAGPLQGAAGDPGDERPSCTTHPQLLGRHDATVVVIADVARADDAGPPAPAGPTLVGLDATEGRVRWEQPLPSAPAAVGMSSDGACWALDPQTPRLRVFDCDTGTPRWDRPLGPGRLVAHGLDHAIVVARHYGDRWRLSAYATADGASTWSARLARRQYPVLPGQPIADAEQPGSRRVYALLDPERGTIVGELVAGRDEKLWRDPAGGFVLTGRELRELDAEGRLTRQRPFTGTLVQRVTADHLLTHDGETIEIYDRDQLRERARLEGRLTIEPNASLPDDRLLLRRPGEDGVALVLGLEGPERGAGRR